MLVFTIRRLNLFIFTFVLLTLLAFSLSFLFPGDALINLSGQVNASEQQLAMLAESYKQNESILSQYGAYLSHILSGDWGLSMTSQTPIFNEMLIHLPATIELTLIALFIAMIVGIPIGFIAAIKHRTPIDNGILTFSMLGYSIPVFWLGLFVILVFAIQLAWLPSSGRISLLFDVEHKTGLILVDTLLSDNPYKWQAFQDAVAHIILPALTVALAPLTIFIRLARTAMMQVLESQYIKAAKAKGLTMTQIIYRHAIRNAMVNVIRDVGLQFANLVTLAMVTEVIFSWPGVGRWLIESIYQRDFTAIQGGLLVLSSYIFIVHIITDFVYAGLNPMARGKKYGA
ncbi:ABC transporter permease [Thalassotalea ganghwensis]